MPYSSTKILFMFTLFSGILITISSNSWLSAWIGLEINLLSFIPITLNSNNLYSTEASLKYFLIQTLASSILLFLIISSTILEKMLPITNSMLSSIIMSTPLLLKMGAAPLHWWFPSVMEGLTWNNCFLLMTFQKLAPLTLLSYLLKINMLFIMIIIFSIFIGAIGGLNQTSIRKMLTYSSINHLGWMLMAMIIANNNWMIYFMIYSLLTLLIIFIIQPFQISFINQIIMIHQNNYLMKFLMFSSLLSLGGLPPFLGFLPKWIIIQSMLDNNFITLSTIMVIFSLITLYYYLRIAYSSFLILNLEASWNISIYKNKNSIPFFILLSSGSLLGLTMFTMSLNTF